MIARRWAFFLACVATAFLAGSCTSGSDEPARDSGSGESESGRDEDSSSLATDAQPDPFQADRESAPPQFVESQFSSLVPRTLQMSWNQAGARRVSPEITLDVQDFGANPDDGQSDSEAFAEAVQAASGAGAIIAIPRGTYHLTETLRLQSGVVLKGEGPDTRLEIDLGDESGIGISGAGEAKEDAWQPVGASIPEGTVEVLVSDSSAFSVGDVVELEQDNHDAMRSKPEWDVDWGDGSEGELAVVVSVGPDALRLSQPLVSAFATKRNARIRPIRAIIDVGIESLTIERKDTGYGHSIGFQFASNVWVFDVVSSVTSRAHIGLDQVRGCTVRDSILHDATDFGDGGRAYGVSLARHTTSCLIVNNTLYDLRHALIIQLGASGNVLAYNHARGSAGYEDRQPRADLSLHGHWPQRNLFEGNVFDRVIFADWWGPSGPANTLHRNCVLHSVQVADRSNDQILVGNLVGSGGLVVEENITGTTRTQNVVEGAPGAGVATTAPETLPDSLWTSVPPDFLSGLQWPPIQATGSAICDLPAGTRSPLGTT